VSSTALAASAGLLQPRHVCIPSFRSFALKKGFFLTAAKPFAPAFPASPCLRAAFPSAAALFVAARPREQAMCVVRPEPSKTCLARRVSPTTGANSGPSRSMRSSSDAFILARARRLRLPLAIELGMSPAPPPASCPGSCRGGARTRRARAVTAPPAADTLATAIPNAFLRPSNMAFIISSACPPVMSRARSSVRWLMRPQTPGSLRTFGPDSRPARPLVLSLPASRRARRALTRVRVGTPFSRARPRGRARPSSRGGAPRQARGRREATCRRPAQGRRPGTCSFSHNRGCSGPPFDLSAATPPPAPRNQSFRSPTVEVGLN
jgi:hypothetical protein